MSGPRAGQYYRMNSSRLSFAEFWRETRSPVVLLGWLTKLLRIKLSGSAHDPNVVTLESCRVDGDAVDDRVPADQRQAIESVMEELRGLGFVDPPIHYFFDDRFHTSRRLDVLLRHRDGKAIARVVHRAEGPGYKHLHYHTQFLTPLTDGTFLVSSSAKGQSYVPVECVLNYHPKASATALWATHREALAAQSVAPGDISSQAEAAAALEKHHALVRDFQIQRGIFGALEGDDLTQAQALDGNLAADGAAQTRHPEVLAQLTRMQNSTISWTNAIVVLVGSIALFLILGMKAWDWSWEMVLMIIGILLVHEAGHFIAMRMFNYRNVRMFFIPLFGAAVSGENYTAPAWKKVVVALAGPLPGIALGAAIGLAAIRQESEFIMQIAMMTIILNALQLLPILPLDGGRVMHTVFFSRNVYLDVIFQIVGVALLFLLALATSERFLLIFSTLLIISLPTTFKLAQIVGEMRKTGYTPEVVAPRKELVPIARPASTVDDATDPVDDVSEMTTVRGTDIPQPIMETIVDQVKAKFPKMNLPKPVAQLSLRVYESLATRPPSVGPSIGFTALHGGSFVASFFLLAFLAVAQQPGFWDLLSPYQTESFDVAVAEISEFRDEAPGAAHVSDSTEEESTVDDGQQMLVARFADPSAAKRAFEEFSRNPPPGGAALLFGQSVLFRASMVMTSWFDDFEERGTSVFAMSGTGPELQVDVKCSAATPAAAAAITEKLSSYLEMPNSIYLIPPWAGDEVDVRTPIEREDHEAMRWLFARLRATYGGDDEAYGKLQEELDRAMRRNDEAERDRLIAEQSKLALESEVAALEEIRDGLTVAAQLEFVDDYITIRRRDEAKASDNDFSDMMNRTQAELDAWLFAQFADERTMLGPKMGQLPLASDGVPATADLKYSTRNGYVSQAAGKTVSVSLAFEDVLVGLPALLRWLDAQGCDSFRYSFWHENQRSY